MVASKKNQIITLFEFIYGEKLSAIKQNKFIRRLLFLPIICFVTLFINSDSYAQIQGPSIITNNGQTYSYNIPTQPGAIHYVWEIQPHSAVKNILSIGQPYTTITLNPNYIGSATLTCDIQFSGSGNQNYRYNISILAPLVAPVIQSANQIIYYNHNPNITITQPASGVDGNYIYQWQTQTSNNANAGWTNVGSPTNSPVPLTSPTLTSPINNFRLYVINPTTGTDTYSNIVSTSVYPQFVPAVISTSTPTIYYNTVPLTNIDKPASGSDGNYTNKWEILTPQNTWVQYNFTPLTDRTNSIRLSTTTGEGTVSSNVLIINVYPEFKLPTIQPINQQIFYNTSADITFTPASGGDGNYTYQWETLNTSNNWVSASDPFSNPSPPYKFNTGLLTTQTNIYRLTIIENGVKGYSNTATVNVYPQFTIPSITPVTQQIFNNTTATISASSFATGGTGSFTYQWQILNNSNGWVPIRNPIVNPSTLPVLITDPLTAQTNSFRLVATDNGQANPPTPLVSNTATVNVYPPYVTPSVTPATQQIFSNNTATISASSFATGGTGRFTYQWQTLNSSNTWDNSGPLIDEPTTLPVLNTIPLTALSNTFRLVAKDKGQVNDLPLISNTAVVSVYAPITPPTIIPITQQLFYNKSATISASSFATGGDGNFTYQWQMLNSSNNWDNVGDPIDRPTDLPVLTQNNLTAQTYSFRLSVIDKGQVNGTTLYSNTATVTVYRQFVVPTISPDNQTICYNTTASFATPAAATGSDGKYSYQWQISTDKTTWSNLTPSPSQTPQPVTTSALTLPTYYVQYTVTTSEGFLSSNIVTINVTPQIGSGKLSCATLNINAGVVPAPITSTAPTNGCGNQYFRWQYSTGGAYSDVQGATNSTLTFTSGVSITTSYILYTKDNTGEVASKPITITVSSPPCISYTGNQGQVYTYNVKISPLSINSNCGPVPATTYATVSTFAGGSKTGSADGAGSAASFYSPSSLVGDGAGNVYVADTYNGKIRIIDPNGNVSTLVVNDKFGNAAGFTSPQGLAIDGAGNLYVLDGGQSSGNFLLRKISTDKIITTLNSNVPGNLLAIDPQNNIYVVKSNSSNVYKITANGTKITTISASGTFSGGITAIAVDRVGNLFVGDKGHRQIKEYPINNINNTWNVLAGSGTQGSIDGKGTAATFNSINSLTVNATGDIYVVDGNLIRMVTPDGIVTTTAGNLANVYGSVDGVGTAATFNNPVGITMDTNGNLYTIDGGTYIRKIVATGYTINPALPAGLVLNSTNGEISGTPAVLLNPSINYRVTAFNASGSGFTDNLNISINGTPAINSFNPVSAAIGTTININGLGFTGATGVSFGVTKAQSFKVISDTQILAVVAAGTSGSITVTTASGGTLSLPGFTYIAPPAISFTPTTQTYSINATLKTNPVPNNKGGNIPLTTFGAVSTFAGSSTSGFANNNGQNAMFNAPSGLVTDAAGNIYVADKNNNVIRKIAPNGDVSTFAGSGQPSNVDALGTAASFVSLNAICIDKAGNLFVIDYFPAGAFYVLRKITPNGNVTTLRKCYSSSIAIDAQNNIYVAGDTYGNIQKITQAGQVSVITGNGNFNVNPGTGNGPTGLAVDNKGNLFAADAGNNQIKELPVGSGTWKVFAGTGQPGAADGAGVTATFNNPYSITTDAAGNVYVADQNNYSIRMISPLGVVSTIAGNAKRSYADGIGNLASFIAPSGITADGNGNLYTIDNTNIIRKIVATGFKVSPALIAGLNFDGTTGTISGAPTALSTGTVFTITGYNVAGASATTLTIKVNQVAAPVIKYTPQTSYTQNTTFNPSLLPANSGGAIPSNTFGLVSTYATGGINGTFSGPAGIAIDSKGNTFVSDFGRHTIWKITPAGIITLFAGNQNFQFGNYDGNGTNASFYGPAGLAIDAADNIYVADYYNNAIRKISQNGDVITIAGNPGSGNGDGSGTAATFNGPADLKFDNAGILYVADMNNNLIRKIDQTYNVTTIAGKPGSAILFNAPHGLAVDKSKNIYVADFNNNAIRKIDVNGIVTNYAGTLGAGAQNGDKSVATFNQPAGLAIDASGNLIVTDYGNNLVRYINIKTGLVSTLAGTLGNSGATNGVGGTTFYGPNEAATDAAGNVYIIDSGNSLVRKINLTGYTINDVLPAGLSFDGLTGTISGTPTVIVTKNYTVTGYNSAGSSSSTFKLTINKATAKTAALLFEIEEPTVNTAPYPMPFTSALNINLGNTEIANLTVQIFNTNNGSLVYNQQLNGQSGILTLDVSNLTKGFYGLHLIYNNNHKIYKIFK